MAPMQIRHTFSQDDGGRIQCYMLKGEPGVRAATEDYTQMPYPLLRFFEFAVQQLPGYTAKLVGLATVEGHHIVQESYGIEVSPIESGRAETGRMLRLYPKLLQLNQRINCFHNGGVTSFYIPAIVTDSELAGALYYLSKEPGEKDLADENPFTAWTNLCNRKGLKRPFSPGILPEYQGEPVLHMKFISEPARTGGIQRDGWVARSFPAGKAGELTIAISRTAVHAVCHDNLVELARYLTDAIETQKQRISAAHPGENVMALIPWRHIVYRALNVSLPGYWDVADWQATAQFHINVF